MKKTFFVLLVTALVALLGGIALGGEVFHGGDVIYTKPVEAVLFSHAVHVEQTGLPCEMCHSGLFEMESLAAQKEPDFTMAGLYEGKYCGGCHMEGSMAFASNTQCARCHIGVKGNRKLTGEPEKTGH